MEAIVRLPNGGTDIVAGFLQGDTSTLYLLINCLDYSLQALIEKVLTFKKMNKAEDIPRR